jgi:flagellar basal-body rod modification protein FlgD
MGGATAVGGVGAGTAAPDGLSGGAAGGGLDRQFLQLLVAQLRYQDPLQPVDSTSWVTQLVQLQMLTVLTEIKADVDKLAGQGGGPAPSGGGAR